MRDVLFFNADNVLTTYLDEVIHSKINPILFKESLNHIDEKELTIFAEKVKDLTQKDWTELVGLFKTEEVEKNM